MMTAQGYRYFNGVGTAFLEQLLVVVVLALGPLSSLPLIADGARWIRNFFTDSLSPIACKTMLLDWHHLEQKCRELSSRICRNKTAKAHLLRCLYRRLWRGDVPAALTVFEAQRPAIKNAAKLGALLAAARRHALHGKLTQHVCALTH